MHTRYRNNMVQEYCDSLLKKRNCLPAVWILENGPLIVIFLFCSLEQIWIYCLFFIIRSLVSIKGMNKERNIAFVTSLHHSKESLRKFSLYSMTIKSHRKKLHLHVSIVMLWECLILTQLVPLLDCKIVPECDDNDIVWSVQMRNYHIRNHHNCNNWPNCPIPELRWQSWSRYQTNIRQLTNTTPLATDNATMLPRWVIL